MCEKVMKMSKDLYRVGCECNDPECDIGLFVDSDGLYVMCKAKASSQHHSRLKAFWWRIKTAVIILFSGYIMEEHELLIRNTKHIDGIITALLKLKSQIEEERSKA